MAEDQHNTETNDQAGETPEKKSAIERARDELIQKVAEQQPVVPIVENTQQEKSSESDFIDFAVKKSQEIPNPPEIQTKKDTKKEKEHGDAIRTYHSDVAETIRDRKLSLTGIVVAEQARRADSSTGTETEEEPFSWKRLLLSFGSGLFVAGSIALVIFLYITYKEQPKQTPTPIMSLVLANEQITIDATNLTRGDFLSLLDEAVESTKIKTGEIINISLVAGTEQKKLNAPELLALLQTSVDEALLRSIENSFMLGIYTTDAPQVFLILKTTFFENAFAGMLRWENSIATELPFLVREVKLQIPTFATSSPTSTVALTVPTTNNFEDIVVDNKDARGRLAPDGKYDIVYSFVDPGTIIITNNIETLRAVLDRFVVSRFEQ